MLWQTDAAQSEERAAWTERRAVNEQEETSPCILNLIGLVVGIAVGLALMMVPNGLDIAKNYILPWGTIFLNLLKFIVVPIVLFSIASGVISMQDIGRVGSVGGKTQSCIPRCTTAFAVVLALVLASAAKGMHIFAAMETSGLAYEPPAGQSLMQTIIDIFPSNPITPLANASMLQVIVISLLVGFGILLAGEKGLVAAQVVDSFNEVSMKIMDLIIKLSPIGVACLICPVIVENGPNPGSAGGGAGGGLCGLYRPRRGGVLQHGEGPGRRIPIAFFKGMAPAMMMAFSSASSVGTLPFTLECSERLGARKEVASFVLPLGATINMDGTAIYQGVCAVFIASCYGIDLTIGQMATIVLTATLASIGTAGVPGAGMVMLAMVLQSVNIPVEGIALVAGIDRIFDMGRTTINITGDAACAVVVSKMEDRKVARTKSVLG